MKSVGQHPGTAMTSGQGGQFPPGSDRGGGDGVSRTYLGSAEKLVTVGKLLQNSTKRSQGWHFQ